MDKIGKAVPTTGKTNLNDLSTYLNTEVKKALDKSILKLKIKDTTALKAHIDNALNTSNFDPSQIKAVQRRLNQFVYQKSSVPSAVNRATRKEIDVLIKQRDRIKGTYPYGLSQAEQAERAAIQDGINALKTSRGSISGKSLQRADSDFRKLINNYSTSSDAKQRELADVFRTAYKSFDKTLQRDNSKNALTAYNSAKSAYGDFLVISKAGTSSAAQGSTFTPAQLLRASKAADKTSGKATTYRGEGRLQDMGRLGQDVIGSTLADSGTTPRAIISAGMLGGGAIVDPTSALISGGVLGAYQNPATQQLLLRLLQSSGAFGRASINPLAGRFGAELAQ